MEITQTPAGYVLAVSTGDAPTCDVDIELDGPLLIVRASGPTPHERRFLLLERVLALPRIPAAAGSRLRPHSRHDPDDLRREPGARWATAAVRGAAASCRFSAVRSVRFWRATGAHLLNLASALRSADGV